MNDTVARWDDVEDPTTTTLILDPDNETLSFDAQLADLDALADYLCGSFGISPRSGNHYRTLYGTMSKICAGSS